MSEDSSFGNLELPIVTVFGAGIAGLTAAHELVERGFQVQVVEPSPHPLREYECSVGGLAANQFSRVRAPFQVLHPWLMQDNTLNLGYVLAFRDWNSRIEPAERRYPLLQRLRFDRNTHQPPAPHGPVGKTADEFDLTIRSRLEKREPPPQDWTQYWDAHGVLNAEKLEAIYQTIRRASRHYMRAYFPKLAAALDRDPHYQPQSPQEWRDLGCPIHNPDTKPHPTPVDELARQFVARETFCVRIVAYTDADSTQDQNRALARHWAQEVHDWLIRRNGVVEAALDAVTDERAAAPQAATAFLQQPIWELARRLEIDVRGSAQAKPTADPRKRSLANRVEFEVIEQIIPGEHGFRFFPGFYRHLFDTMRRTRVFDEDGLLQGSAYDQLVRTPGAQLSLPGGLHDFDFRNLTSMSQGKAVLDLMTKTLGMTKEDLIGLTLKLFRFKTSGPRRRQAQTEDISMVQYMGGDTPERLFSQAALDFVDKEPRALAAMSARESDARSQYSIAIQLGLASVPDPATLNGPTSIAWLDPWKTYLKRQGVKFFIGRLVDMKPQAKEDWPGETQTRLVPFTQGPLAKTDENGRDLESLPLPENPDDVYQIPGQIDPSTGQRNGYQHRFVLAAQFQNSSDLAWKAKEQVERVGGVFAGPLAQIVEFDRISGRRTDNDDRARPPRRDPVTGKEQAPWPSRTISGAQFFFPQSYKIGRSNVYFSFTPYALTSISQYPFWRQHSGPVGQLLGQISIDLGDWHSPYPADDPKRKTLPGHPAFYSSSQEVADNTWAQVVEGLSPAYAQVIQPPSYYHLDTNMVFVERRVSGGDEPGWIIEGGVRANAILRVPHTDNAAAALALVPGRLYWAQLQVGQAGAPIRSKPVAFAGGAPKAVRDEIFDDLVGKADGRLLLAKARQPKSDLETDIVVSPVSELPGATLRVVGASAAPFRLAIDNFEVSVTGRSPAGVVDALVEALERQGRDFARVSRPAPDRLSLAPVGRDTFRVGVLNLDGKIELIGAPSLVVTALNLEVPEPPGGFVLIRNDYQYIIDVPGQWGYRPGLRRDPGGVPQGFAQLAADFGVKRPEIYYAHPESAPLLEKWVCAGAHMATYTRMTTMEAANESGRHAAAAVIYELHQAAKYNRELHYEALAGDFPWIYPVEDYEGDDFDVFKKLDDILFDMGQPHLFEIIGLTQLVEAIQAKTYHVGQLQAALAPLFAGLPAAPGLRFAAPEFSAKLADLIQRISKAFGTG